MNCLLNFFPVFVMINSTVINILALLKIFDKNCPPESLFEIAFTLAVYGSACFF